MPYLPPGGDGGDGQVSYPIDQMQLTSSSMNNQTQTLIKNIAQTMQKARSPADTIDVLSVYNKVHAFLTNMEQSLGQLLDYRNGLGVDLGSIADMMHNIDQGSATPPSGRHSNYS